VLIQFHKIQYNSQMTKRRQVKMAHEPEPLVADIDEVMVEADTNDDVAVEMETFEDAKSSERDSEPNANNAQAS
jgi:hypothetical protein